MNGWQVEIDDSNLDYRITPQKSWQGKSSFQVGQSKSKEDSCSNANLRLYKVFTQPTYIKEIKACVYRKTGEIGTGQLEIDGVLIGDPNALTGSVKEWEPRVWTVDKMVMRISFSYRQISKYDRLFIDDIKLQ